MSSAEKVREDALLQAAELVVVNVSHTGTVRSLATALTNRTGNVYACPCGCGKASYPGPNGVALYGPLDESSREHDDLKAPEGKSHS